MILFTVGKITLVAVEEQTRLGKGQEWSQGDRKGTVAATQERHDGGLGWRSDGEDEENEMKQRLPAVHQRSTSIVHSCGWETAAQPESTFPRALCL